VFQDSEMTTVFQTNVKDRDFIIIYSNAYYINESRFILIEEFSKNVLEQRERVYEVGDVVQIRGTGGNEKFIGWRNWTLYSITVISVVRENVNETVRYSIKFSISPDVEEHNVLGFFQHVTTKNGRIYRDFILVNNETVSIEIPNSEIIEVLVLNVTQREFQSYVSQDSPRMVRLSSD